MKVSIVMAYYNRRGLLLNTLKTLYYSKHIPEIIIVDDGSDEENRIEDLVNWPGLDIYVKRIEPEEKTWTNPCIPYNMGFKEATGDIVIIQNPECLHIRDVMDYAVNNLTSGKYISFSCYSADENKCEIIGRVNDYKIETINKILEPFVNSMPQNDGLNGWYNNSKYNPNAFHFCSAITMNDLKILGGFDEAYANGIGYDDFDLIARIRRMGMSVEICDEPYTVHQAHKPTDYANRQHLLSRNSNIYNTGKP